MADGPTKTARATSCCCDEAVLSVFHTQSISNRFEWAHWSYLVDPRRTQDLQPTSQPGCSTQRRVPVAPSACGVERGICKELWYATVCVCRRTSPRFLEPRTVGNRPRACRKHHATIVETKGARDSLPNLWSLGQNSGQSEPHRVGLKWSQWQELNKHSICKVSRRSKTPYTKRCRRMPSKQLRGIIRPRPT